MSFIHAECVGSSSSDMKRDERFSYIELQDRLSVP